MTSMPSLGLFGSRSTRALSLLLVWHCRCQLPHPRKLSPKSLPSPTSNALRACMHRSSLGTAWHCIARASEQRMHGINLDLLMALVALPHGAL